MKHTKQFNKIIEKFLCCVPSNVIKYTANLASGQQSPWPLASNNWSPYANFTVGVLYFLRLRISTNNGCDQTLIFDSVPSDTSGSIWQFYTYKLTGVILNLNGLSYGCGKGQSICVSIGMRVDQCGNPIPGQFVNPSI